MQAGFGDGAPPAAGTDLHLHVLIDRRDGRLTSVPIHETVPGWREANTWFGGPAGFGTAIKGDFAAQGWPVKSVSPRAFQYALTDPKPVGPGTAERTLPRRFDQRGGVSRLPPEPDARLKAFFISRQAGISRTRQTGHETPQPGDS